MPRFIQSIVILFPVYLLLVLSACSQESPYLNVNRSSISFTDEGGSQIIFVSSNNAWTASVSGTGFSITPDSGTGDANIKVSALPASETDPVSGSILFKSEGLSQSVELHQDARKVILVGEAARIPSEGGSVKVDIRYNTDYTVTVEESAKDWIEVLNTGTKALTSGEMVFSFKENNYLDSRTGKVTVKDNSKKVEPITLTFVQDGAEPFLRIISPESGELPYNAGKLTILIEHNVGINLRNSSLWEIESDGNYSIFKSPFEHKDDSPFIASWTLNYTKNDTRTVRSGRIIVYDERRSMSDTLYVYQPPVKIIISDLETMIPVSGAEFSFRVSENTQDSFSLEFDSTWIELIEIKDGEGGAQYRWRAKENPYGSMREAKISVYRNGFSEPDVFTACQEGRGLSVSVTYSSDKVTAPYIFGQFFEKSSIWWGDGSTMPYSGGISHTYSTPGRHTVSVKIFSMKYIQRAEVTDLEDGMHIDFSNMKNHYE